MSKYEAKVSRDSNYWIVEIDGIGVTQTRRLSEVTPMAIDYIAAIEDVDPETVSVETHIAVPADVQVFLDKAEALRAESDKARDDANEATSEAAGALKDKGLTVREIGPVLGVSFQRAQQMLAPKKSGWVKPHGDRKTKVDA